MFGPASGMAGTVPDTRLAALPEKTSGASSPEAVALGRWLFFDPILSATGTVACATCHHPDYGWADGRATPLGVYSEGLGPRRQRSEAAEMQPLPRNTPTILNVAFNGLRLDQVLDPKTAPMFWDNRVQGLEAQVIHPIQSREEMRGDACTEAEAVPLMVQRLKQIPLYRQHFAQVFQGEITSTRVMQSIATFERSLIACDSPFDRFMRGDSKALNALQKRGLETFHRAGCSLCHNGPMLSDYQLHAIGVNDAGSRRDNFRTPTLRQLRDTAPYMHHGEMRTLDEVLLFYDRLMDHAAETLDGGDQESLPPLDPLLRQMSLLPDDHEQLKAFLEALNSDTFDRSIPASVPSGLPVAGQGRSK